VESPARPPFDLEVLAEYQRRQAAPDSAIQPEDDTPAEPAAPPLEELSDEDLDALSRELDLLVAEGSDETSAQALAELQAVERERRRRREASDVPLSEEDEELISRSEEELQDLVDAAMDRKDYQEVDRIKALIRRKRRRATIS
jgi:hypothetical protein